MKRKKQLQMIFTVALCIAAVIFVFNGKSIAADICATAGGDQGTPVEVSGLGTGLPNMMFIFDNSDSMQDAPYLNSVGASVRPSMEWHKGYKVVNNVITGTGDTVDYVYSAEGGGSDNDIAIPVQTVPTAYSGAVEATADTNPGNYVCIHSAGNTALGTIATDIAAYYKRVIKVTTTSSQQLATIKAVVEFSNKKYFELYTPPMIDYTGFDYSNPNSYTHSFSFPVAAGPGNVTMKETDAKYVCDANVNWTQVNTDFNTKYKGAFIEITDGTNKGEKRKITAINTTEKRWEVESAFSALCDLTTKYKILGMPASLIRKAYGGNHPASKLYQAKKALLTVLSSPDLKKTNSEDYKMNMGFATYMSARVPRVTSRYYRAAGTDQTVTTYRGYYRKLSDTSSDFYHPTSSTEFSTGSWSVSSSATGTFSTNVNHTNVSVGYAFYRKYTEHSSSTEGTYQNCDQQVLKYILKSITPSPTDSQPNRKKFTVASNVADGNGYYDYAWQSPTFTGTIDCSKPVQLPAMPDTYTSGSSVWTKVASPDACNKPNECFTTQQSAYYKSDKMMTTYGNYSISDSTAAGYINKDTGRVTTENIKTAVEDGVTYTYKIIPDIWMLENGQHTTSLESPLTIQCKNSDGTWYDCSLGSEGEKRVVLKQICTDATCTTKKDIPANVVDTTYFTYPGEGITDRPHGWSYKKTDQAYVYSTNQDNLKPQDAWRAKWGDSLQKNPYFPANSNHDYGQTDSIAGSGDTANDFANHRGDDQILFVNLPKYNTADTTNYGDDITGSNIARIKSFVNLGRVSSPSDSGDWGDNKLKIKGNDYDYTMMPYTNSLPCNMREEIYTGKGTPLAASLADAKKYFQSYYAQDLMSQKGCRGNYIILLTDGLETCDGTPKTVAEELRKLFVTSPERGVKTFVIGFGMDTSSKASLDEIAAAGGSPGYKDADGNQHYAYFASSSDELVKILLEDILNSLVGEGVFSQSSASISQEIQSSDDLRIYYTYFDYPGWAGHLNAYLIKDDGTIGNPVAEWTGGCSALSDAGCEITKQGAANRTIYTWTGSNADATKAMTLFTTANKTTLKTSLIATTDDINGNGTANEDADAETVINYVRDPGYDSGKYAGSRNPAWLLGDIWHSTPVVVTPPGFEFGKDGYDTFKTDHATRAKIIYVGANDGMLHAINHSDGKERWAYIPKSLLGKVKELMCGHRYLVDGPITIADLALTTAVNVSGADWKTVLIGGLRDGGTYYYALDVTYPSDPKPLWGMTDTDSTVTGSTMGNTWSKAAMGIININGDNTPVVFVGGGYSPNTAAKGNSVYILDARSGAILKEFAVGESMNNVPAELLTVKYREIGGKAVDFFDEKELDDLYKGNIEVVYFGDTSGAVWRIGTEVTSVDANGTATYVGGLNSKKTGSNKYDTWNPKLVKLYAPSEAGHPIFYKPGIADYPTQGKCRFILFGTGNGANPNDTTQQYFCEIKDDPDKVMNGDAQIMWKTGSTIGTVTVPALGAREQVLSDPVVFQGKVYFTTYMPPQTGGTAQCADVPIGTSYLYVVNVSTCSSVGGIGKRGYLGAGIATSPIISAPKVYVHIEAGPSGSTVTPETAAGWGTLTIESTGALKTAAAGGTGAGQMIYWREVE